MRRRPIPQPWCDFSQVSTFSMMATILKSERTSKPCQVCRLGIGRQSAPHSLRLEWALLATHVRLLLLMVPGLLACTRREAERQLHLWELPGDERPSLVDEPPEFHCRRFGVESEE